MTDWTLIIDGVTIKLNSVVDAYIVPVTGLSYKNIKVRLVLTEVGGVIEAVSADPNSTVSYNLNNLLFSKDSVIRILETRGVEEVEKLKEAHSEKLKVTDWKLKTVLADLQQGSEYPSFEVGE